MKSLDINTSSTNFGAYNNRKFLIEFTGGNFTERLQGTTTHKVIVPYGSLSKKLKTIQRLGSRVVNVSIYPQNELLNSNFDNASTEQINEPILEIHHELLPKESAEQPIAETLKNEATEVDEITSGAFPEFALQPVVEISHKEASETNSENVSAATQVVTPKKQKAVSESTLSSKKTKASTKSSQGISKPKSNSQVQKTIAIAEKITVSEQVLEPLPAVVVETISAIIPEINLQPEAEEILPILAQTESQEPIAPMTKAKAPRNSSKSGHGFNKSKSDAKSPRSPKQPKN